MQHALKLADRAADEGEVPVGAVLVSSTGQMLGEGWNRLIGTHDATAHAEVQAIRAAGSLLGNYRLADSVLYVTLEPCLMCVGAIVHARIGRLVFGAHDPKTGAVHSRFSLLEDGQHNHRVDVVGGVLEDRCAEQLKEFFRVRRAMKRS